MGEARAAPTFDIEGFIRGRRAWGWSEDEIQKEIKTRITEIFVFPWNRYAVDVFMQMRPVLHATMAGVFYEPAPTGEVLAVIQAIRPAADIEDTLTKFRTIESAFIQELNQRGK